MIINNIYKVKDLVYGGEYFNYILSFNYYILIFILLRVFLGYWEG